MVENAVNIETKTGLQLPSGTKEIDSKYSKGYRPLVKKNEDDAYWEHCNKASNKEKKKAKSHNLFSFANQLQTQASNFKKRQKNWQGSHSATGINTTKVAKKDKNKAKNLSHVKCYTCKQKGYYANKCLEKPKN